MPHVGSPWAWISAGLAVTVAGAALLAIGTDDGPALATYAGLLVAGLGGLALILGLVAGGVAMGLEHYDRLTGRDPLK